MTDKTQELGVAIYRNEPALEWSLYELDTGSLLQQLTVPPSHLTDGIDGTIRLEVERTHEWELLIGIALAGGTAFLEGAISELGKQFVDWLVKQAAKLGTRSHAAVRPAGGQDLVVEPSELVQAEREIVKLLREAMESGTKVKLIVECGQ